MYCLLQGLEKHCLWVKIMFWVSKHRFETLIACVIEVKTNSICLFFRKNGLDFVGLAITKENDSLTKNTYFLKLVCL